MTKRLLIFFLCSCSAYLVFPQHQKKIDSLEARLNESIHDTTRVKILGRLCDEYSRHGDFKTSVTKGEQALELAEKTGFKRILPYLYNNLGNTYTTHSDYPKGLQYLQKALDLRLKANDRKAIAMSYNNIAIVYYSLADFNKAIDYFQKALKIEETLGDNYHIAAYIGNIAVLYEELGEDSLSMIYQQRSFDIHKKMNTLPDMAASLSNLGILYSKKGDFVKAIECLDQALDIVVKNDLRSLYAQCYGNIGLVYIKMNQPEKAIQNLETALKVILDMGDRKASSGLLTTLASAYKMLGNNAVALERLQTAYDLAESIGSKQEQKQAAELLYEIYKDLRKTDKALFFHEKWATLKDSIYNQSKNEGFNKLKTQFALDRQEHELKSKAEEALKKKEEEKKQQRFIIYFAIIGLVITLVFAVVLFQRFKITRSQKKIIEMQKELVEIKSKETTDSIRYAKGIQQALLAHNDYLEKNLPEHFVLYKPKDIVSGDFYWATSMSSELRVVRSEKENNSSRAREIPPNPKLRTPNSFYLAVCDCTGHGVPGAFMSLLNISFLNEAINEKNIEEPGQVFDHIRSRLIETISRSLDNSVGGKDGMDGILLKIDRNGDQKKLTYAAANNGPVLISGGKIIELQKDKMPIGKGETEKNFTGFSVNANSGDILYLYTDGFADQFGGPENKKYKRKQLNELLLSVSSSPMREQGKTLDERFEAWKGNNEQVDDVCIIGIKI